MMSTTTLVPSFGGGGRNSGWAEEGVGRNGAGTKRQNNNANRERQSNGLIGGSGGVMTTRKPSSSGD